MSGLWFQEKGEKMENIVKEHILLKQKYRALLEEYNCLRGTFNLTVDLVDGYLKNIIAERNDLRGKVAILMREKNDSNR